MRENLKDIQLNVPFSTVGSVLLAGGEEAPIRLGRNCVGQCRALAADLEMDGYETGFVHLSRDKGTHFGVLAEDGSTYFLDPSAIHHEPINLTQLFRDRISVLVDSFPIVKGTASNLLVEAIGPSKFTLKKNVFDGVSFDERFAYEFDLDTRSKSLPKDDDPYIASMHKDKLVLRTAEEDGTLTTLTHRFDLLVRQIRRASKKGIDEFTVAHFDGKFMAHIEDVAERLAMSPSELVAYFDTAARVFSYVKGLAR